MTTPAMGLRRTGHGPVPHRLMPTAAWTEGVLTVAFRASFLLTAVLLPAPGVQADEVPPRAASGQTLVIPAEQVELGEVYHVAPGTGTQLLWTSDAPLLRITSSCSRVVGYVVAPFDLEADRPPLLAGAFRVPVASLRSGVRDQDDVLHGPTALNVAEYPEITLRISGVSDAKFTGEDKQRKSYTLTATAELTVKDTTVTVELPLQMTFVPFTWATMPVNLGDFVILRTHFDVKLADLGVQLSPRPNPDFQTEAVTLDWFLLCSLAPPDKNIDPAIKHEHYRGQLRLLTLLRDFDDPDKGYAFGRELARSLWDEPSGPNRDREGGSTGVPPAPGSAGVPPAEPNRDREGAVVRAKALDRLASAVLTEDGIRTRDFAFVLELARRANELTAHQDPALLHTLARAYWDRGEPEPALKWIRQAVEHLAGAPPDVAEQVRATLQRFEKATPDAP